MQILVAGWFSFKGMGATAGDLISREIVCSWLREAGLPFDVALAGPCPPETGVDWREIDAGKYNHVVFVCGPFGNGWPLTEFLSAFSNAKLIGVNLSLLQSLDTWNPFHLLFERDSSVASHPDISFQGKPSEIPVVGVILVHKQKEYGKRALHETAEAVINRFLCNTEAAVVYIDTAIPNNKGQLRTPAEVEALIKKMDLVITTRLHGTVLTLKNGVPVIPIDPIAGGAKITQQVKTIGWPVLFNAESLNISSLSKAYQFCLTPQARLQAEKIAERSIAEVEKIHQAFVRELKVLAESK
ncbi:MAG: hypothetical protein JWP78_2206 [Mucilaginibacter sp.]|nr:hypothetical protein [Mucilaginibacter sp.]